MKKKIILSAVFSLLVICNALPLHNSNDYLKNEQTVQISHKKKSVIKLRNHKQKKKVFLLKRLKIKKIL